MSISNTGNVDLESVLSVRRRTLAAIGESIVPRAQPHYTDTVYLKREDNSNSILSINSKIFLLGELQFLYSIFERYTSHITIHEDSLEGNAHSPVSGKKPSFTATLEETEDDHEAPPMVSTVRQTSTTSSKGSASPPQAPSSPTRNRAISPLGRPQALGIPGEFTSLSLEGKRYGSIQLPNMPIIEIIEILLRNGLELLNVSSEYDKENILHQNFVFSKTRSTAQKFGQFSARSASFVAT